MKLSIVIPVYNGADCLSKCLQALKSSTRLADEVLVVDDGSTDTSAEVASAYGALTLRLAGGRHGPAFARNRGAESASGELIVFIDSDIAVHPDTLALVDKYLSTASDVAAVFGSYDDDPLWREPVSLYKNLQHHFVHQHSKREASSFWAGCGAIRRQVFLAVHGFDERYDRPSIEDIELGLRLRQSRYRVQLCPEIQVKHLKRWKLSSLLRADIFDRAFPWARLIVSSGRLPSDLNLDMRGRSSAVLVWAMIVFALLGFWSPWGWGGAAAAVFALVMLNSSLYLLFLARGGLGFAVAAFGLHILYFLYSSIVFGLVAIYFVLTKEKREFEHAS